MAEHSYHLKYPARALAVQVAEGHKSQWVVGTNARRDRNELHVLEYDADLDKLQAVRVLAHDNEIWDIATCPESVDRLITVHSKGGAYGATLWRATPSGEVAAQADLQGHSSIVRSALWHPKQTRTVLTVEESGINKFTVDNERCELTGQGRTDDLQQCWRAAMPATNAGTACAAAGASIQLWDLNNMTKVGEIAGAHKMPVRDLHFACGNEHRLVTGGEGGRVKFWDLRTLSGSGAAVPLAEFSGHSHWVWRVRFNPVHESLVASSSGDTRVALYHVPHLARLDAGKAPDQGGHGGGRLSGMGGPGSAHSGVPAQRHEAFEEHGDSVYGLEWSLADPWLLASLSYDGHVVLNRVPSKLKYKILV